MPVGPGAYDDLCTLVRQRAKAQAAIVIVLGGDRGQGFSVQTTDPALLLMLAGILEDCAREIRVSAPREVQEAQWRRDG